MNKKILFIDDDVDDQDLFKAALKAIGVPLKYEFASNGIEALNSLEKQSNVDLIFLDLSMPILNGFDTLRLLKQAENNIPVYILSTSTDKKDKDLCFQLGANGFISKTSVFTELCDRLDEVMVSELQN